MTKELYLIIVQFFIIIKGVFMKKIDFLIDYLIKENKNINIKEIPKDIENKKSLYRSLCNIKRIYKNRK